MNKDRGDPDMERLNKLLQLEREVERVRALPVERNIPNHQDNPLLYKRISNIPNSRYAPFIFVISIKARFKIFRNLETDNLESLDYW